MGQPISVVKKPGSEAGVVRFETNRVLTGMGHERYTSVEDILDDRTVDELARRLFDTGLVQAVHVNSNVVTVGLADDATDAAGASAEDQLMDVIRNLHIHYPSSSGA